MRQVQVAGRLANLPVRRTRLIGREQDVAAVHELVLHADGHLVTLTGVGGCGKTRLALEVAGALVDEFPDGVWLVELAALADPLLVIAAVAAPLGVQEGPGRSLVEALTAYLQSRSLLLVLDNCEHLVEACAELVERLLSACPTLRILATSREPLRLAGEATWLVPSLAIPDPARRPPLDELAQCPSVQLFAERARAASSGFALASPNAASVARICARLDGIPLAIELAAARVRALGVEQIGERLDDSFRLLIGGRRAAPARHQTLRATLDWSHDLLTAPEQAVFRRLAVFAGGWSLEAAEVVCSDGGVAREEVLDVLTRLVDKSLVLAEGQDGRARYRLLEPVREYGRGRLEASGESEAVRRRHADSYLSLAEAAAPGLRGPAWEGWARRLEREHDNLRAALRWAQERGDAETGQRLGGALWLFWINHGHFGEGQRWLEASLSLPGPVPPSVRAAALYGAGTVAWMRVDYERAVAWSEEGPAVCRELGDAWGASWALFNLGTVAGEPQDYAASRALFDASLALARELGDDWLTVWVLTDLGEMLRDQGDRAAARAALEESLSLARDLGDTRQLAVALGILGYLALERGDAGEAAALARECLGNLQRGGMRWYLPEALELLAVVASMQARPARAARLFGAAAAIREARGTPVPLSNRAVEDRHLSAARVALGEAAFAAAWAEGRALSPDRAIESALAMEEPTPPVAPVPAAPAGGRSVGPLTRREREVASLVARGLSNRQIAEVLVVAERTAERHVSNALGKLGLTSRAQLAIWVVDRGVAASPSGDRPPT